MTSTVDRKTKCYTVLIASSASWRTSRIHIPVYVVQILVLLVGIGGVTVIAGMGSYLRLLGQAADYNSLRKQESILRRQYGQMRTRMGNTSQNLAALQSLAGELTTAYDVPVFGRVPFQPIAAESTAGSASAFRRSVEEFEYLELFPLATGHQREDQPLLALSHLGDLEFIPSLWPVKGRITAYFGERLDPFSGEGAFHTGIDIASHFGDAVCSAAEGTIIFSGERPGYGTAVIIDHGFGYTTLYAHLSKLATQVGANVRRGDVIGYEGQSGRATGPHLHYEVRINNEPVNPWRYLRTISLPHGSEDGAAN